MSAEYSSEGDELRQYYASGRLPAPMRLLFDAHAEINPAAAAHAAHAEALAGAMLAIECPAAMSEDALQRALDAIDALDADAATTPSDAIEPEELAGLPVAVREAMRAAARPEWKFASPGIRVMELLRDGDAKAELLRISPGAGAPTHTHAGVELTLVLNGAFRTGDALYRPGEVCIAGPDVTHRPIAEPGETCFALAVTNGGLKFTGLLGALQSLFDRS